MLTMTEVQQAIDAGSYSISLQQRKEGSCQKWNLFTLVNRIEGNVVRERHEISPYINNEEKLVVDAIIFGEHFMFVWTRVQTRIVLLQVSILPIPPESQFGIRIDAIGMVA